MDSESHHFSTFIDRPTEVYEEYNHRFNAVDTLLLLCIHGLEGYGIVSLHEQSHKLTDKIIIMLLSLIVSNLLSVQRYTLIVYLA